MDLYQVLTWLFEFPARTRQARMMKSRANYSKDHFVRSFPTDQTEYAIMVWDELQTHCSKGFLIAPDDNLNDIFMLAEEELDEFVLDLLRKSKLRVPTPSETVKMAPVRTVCDLVRFLAGCRSASPGS